MTTQRLNNQQIGTNTSNKTGIKDFVYRLTMQTET